MKNKCLFCPKNRFLINKHLGLEARDSIIYEDENVFVTPDIAPLTIGHYLIISKCHIHSFGNASSAVVLSVLNAKKFLQNEIFKDRKLLYFEHGAVIEKSAGTSVDHAHLHVLPIENDEELRDEIECSEYIDVSRKITGNAEAIHVFAQKNQPYLYFEVEGRSPIIYPVDKLPSQFFRMIFLGGEDTNYDWKKRCKSIYSKELFNKTLDLAFK